ncbi:hypothetical protein V6N11_075416 [Hibiscus sabdariffa]|uniref:Reverse transcriptase domain-containing protein n=1 Tax=Hibiscus sabdariffa TaxID=183260 RepID=A0ABR2R757_9ROSI
MLLSEKKDLQKHFTIMTKLLYFLGADSNLKHTILASIPDILQNAVSRHLQSQISSPASIASTIPAPHVPVSIYLGKCDKPTDVIAFIDTGAAKTIMNPDILLAKWWKPHTRRFSTASNDEFVTRLISKPITIQFFPGCSVITTVLGSRLPEFYIKLPFKKDKDVNPTKASHTGMNPEYQKLAEAECNELFQQGLIEPSDSLWACEAFYVNKRSEQVRGKLRLVINYQPFNHFLQDDKFPLPNMNALFFSLVKAQIFSKFDLMVGFWQLGIDPADRPKTGFYLPNHHFQWKVMLFGLKTAPSLFQKAMVKIFQPLMDQILIYIDDILLYSLDKKAHLKLLKHFSELIAQYGVMLSERKMKINQRQIEFLGMHFKEGKYHPGPHIAQELIKFPDKDLSKKQILQFLGIVNYLRDFVPKISKYTNPLRKMLKKNLPQWSTTQSKAIKTLKDILQHLPPLKIPSDGKIILQTDASDKYWGAILFEEKDKKRHLCGYKSGRSCDAEIHYHSTFKEILAIKKAVSKFEFHLIRHHFLVEMDMSSFPQMLKFKQKTVPHPQPKIMMYRASSSKETVSGKKQKKDPETTFNILPNLNPEFPPEVYSQSLRSSSSNISHDWYQSLTPRSIFSSSLRSRKKNLSSMANLINIVSRSSSSRSLVSMEVNPKLKSHSSKKISSLYEGWIEEEYSHIHFGAIKLALNYHGVEGKPVVARIALLDTRYLKYQDVCIGTVEATVNNGLVMVTLFPNFTMALENPNLMDAFKVHIHIVGAQQVESSIISTLYYQIIYRVQDHAFRLGGCGSNDSLLITVNTQEQPHYVHIPRQILKDELIQLLPKRLVTSYDQIHVINNPSGLQTPRSSQKVMGHRR